MNLRKPLDERPTSVLKKGDEWPLKTASPFGEQANTPRFQFSLSGLLIVMVVFAAMATSFLWASRLPLVSDEIHSWIGSVPSTNRDGSDRTTQLYFLLFCYSTPLLMAAFLNIGFSVARYVERRSLMRSTREADGTEES